MLMCFPEQQTLSAVPTSGSNYRVFLSSLNVWDTSGFQSVLGVPPVCGVFFSPQSITGSGQAVTYHTATLRPSRFLFLPCTTLFCEGLIVE